MIKGVIFDLGGTLIRFNGRWETVVYEGAKNTAEWYLKKGRVKLDQEALIHAILEERQRALQAAEETLDEAQMHLVLRRALKRSNAPERATAMIDDALRPFFAPEEAALTPFPDAVSTLKTLKSQGLKVGILSNAPNDPLVQRLVNDKFLRPWVSPVFSSAGLGRRKPALEPFALIAERWNLSPQEIVMVGDSLAADILGAKNAGMHSILATMTENPANDRHRAIQPSHTVSALSQIPPVITQMNHG